jgi:hypothetical protein
MLAEWWGDWSSLLGLIVGLVGFAFAVALLLKAKSAAEAAQEAANGTTQQLQRNFALTDIAATILTAREIMRLQRAERWEIALERYGELKTQLIRVREENPSFSPERKTDIQNVIVQIRVLEGNIEELVSSVNPSPDLARWNKTLSGILETLQSLSVSLTFQGAPHDSRREDD